MKRAISLLLLASLLALAGCTAPAPAAEADGLSVVTTIFAPYDFARAVADDRASVQMLLPPGSEAHSFEPTPQDVISIQNCDLFIYVGGENESWVTDILASLDVSHTRVIALLDVIEALEEETVEGMQAEEHGQDEHEHQEYDEHVWTSPLNAQIIVRTIADKLSLIDAANAEFYASNAQAYCEKLDKLDVDMRAVVHGGSRRTIVFGDRFPVRYFTEEYGLEYFAAFPGCSADAEASAATVAFLIDKVRAENIPVVFSIELSNRKIANAIAEATGAKVLTFTSCHNLTLDEFTAGVTYIDLMYQNLENLKEALS